MIRNPTAAALILLVLTSGCAGVLTGGDLTFTASPISLDEQTVADTSFEFQEQQELAYERSVDVQGETRTVQINSHMITLAAEYQNAPLGHMILLSTPKAGVAGVGLNPLGVVGEHELIVRVLEQTPQSNIDDLNQTANRSVRVLGSEETLSIYTAESANQEVRIALLRITHAGDYVIAVAVYPKAIEGGTEDVIRILKSIKHGDGSG